MAKKHLEPFNPWPGFVDLFASVIMVVLIFMLVLIVNITYYAQFKYKLSYTGSVDVQELMNKKESVSAEEKIEQNEDNSTKDLEATAGIDLTVTDSNLTRQENILYDDWMMIKYLKNEIILDPKTIKDVEKFLLLVKSKYPNHYVSIYVAEPKNQVSASIAKQIALSRSLNIRNLIRKKDYDIDDVVVRLKEKIPSLQTIDYEAGYGIIMINKKK